MYEEVAPSIFRVEIPLPNNPLRSLNSYFIKGHKRTLIVDTGFNIPECKKAMMTALDELDINLDETDFFLTHNHADHSGLVADLTQGNTSSQIYCSKIDAELINQTITAEFWQETNKNYSLYGFPQEYLKEALAMNPAKNYCVPHALDFTFVNEGTVIEVDPYRFVCVFTPGHTPGHMCLYEPAKKLFFSGDHILARITPNITPWPEFANPLAKYHESLCKVDKLDIDLILPGHRHTIKNHKTRIKELIEHHKKRLEEIMVILNNSPQSAYQVATKMTWSLSYHNWDDFPLPQKWFASGEAASHLEYLVKNGKLRKQLKDEVYLFSI